MANEKLNLNWSKLGVKDGGLIDKDRTMRAIEEDLDAWVQSNEIPAETITGAVSQVFNKLQDLDKSKTSLKMNDLVCRALKVINPIEGTEARVMEMIEDYIKSESRAFEDTFGATGLYHSVRGRGAAVHLTTEEYVEKYSSSHSPDAN